VTLQLRLGNGNKGYADKAGARRAATNVYKYRPNEYTTVFDKEANRWWIAIERTVDETTTAVSNANSLAVYNNLPKFGPISRFLGSAAGHLPPALLRNARAATSSHQAISKEYGKLKKLQNLPRAQRKKHALAIRHSEEIQKWMNPSELKSFYGRDVSEKEIVAYYAAKEAQDLEIVLMNASEHILLARQGFRTSTITSPHLKGVGELTVREVELGKVHRGTILDISNNRKQFHKKGDFAAGELSALVKARGLKVVQIFDHDPKAFTGVPKVDYLLVNADKYTTKPLNPVRIPHVDGPHRAYQATHYIKQGVRETLEETGDVVYLRPITMHTGDDVKALTSYAKSLEDIRLAYVAKNFDEVNRLIREEAPLLEGVENLEKLIEAGRFRTDMPIGVYRDGQTPARMAGEENTQFLDGDEGNEIIDYMSSLGRRHKGEKLTLPGPELLYAPLLNPYEASARALGRVANTQALQNYKIQAVETWVKKYEGLLKDAGSETPMYDRFKNSPFKDDVNLTKEQRAEIVQAATIRDNVKALLGQRTKLSEYLEQKTFDVGEWVNRDLGLTRSGNFLMDKSSRDPITALRSFAFDRYLGLFAIDQLYVQPSTAILAMTVDPVNGWKAFTAFPQIRMGLINNTPEFAAKMDTAPWRAVNNLEKGEYQEIMDVFRRTGRSDVGTESAMLDDPSLASVWNNPIARGGQRVREAGRAFFYEGEKANRIVATVIGYKRWKKKNGGRSPKTDRDMNEINSIATPFMANMDREANAFWQRGILGVPTQFAAYTARVAELSLPRRLGGSAEFTSAEKARLAGGQLLLYGTGSIPPIHFLQQQYENAVGAAMPDGMAEDMLANGVANTALEMIATTVSGEKVATDIGSRLGIGKNFFTEIGDPDTGLWEFMLGPTGKTFYDVYDVMRDSVGRVLAIQASDEVIPVGLEVMSDIASLAGSWDANRKANVALDTGRYLTKTGTWVSDVNPTEAFLMRLRVPLESVTDHYSKNAPLARRNVVIEKQLVGDLKILNEQINGAIRRGDMEKADRLATASQVLLRAHIHAHGGDPGEIMRRVVDKRMNSMYTDTLQKLYEDQGGVLTREQERGLERQQSKEGKE
jgi:hypothetical protein